MLLIGHNQICVFRDYIIGVIHLLLFQKLLQFFRDCVCIEYQIIEVLVDMAQYRLFLMAGQYFTLLASFLLLRTIGIILHHIIYVEWQLLLIILIQLHSEINQIGIDILDIVMLNIEFLQLIL